MSGAFRVIVTCEHGGNDVPPPWERCFEGLDEILASHRGWDPGAADLARILARTLDAPLRVHTVSRLLADTNRSPGHPRVLGEPVRGLPPAERARVLELHHRPHRTAVEEDVRRTLEKEAGATPVLHLGVHSFTPVLDGRRRETGIGLLYDPGRGRERALCAAWAEALREALPGVRVHRNRPYRGASDGLTTTLRRRFPPEAYLGVEVEVRSDLLVGEGADVAGVAEALSGTLAQAVDARSRAEPVADPASRPEES